MVGTINQMLTFIINVGFIYDTRKSPETAENKLEHCFKLIISNKLINVYATKEVIPYYFININFSFPKD